MRIVDAHIHVWRLDDGRDVWIRNKIGALQRDFTLEDIQAHYGTIDIDGVFIVQAATDRTETNRLLTASARDPYVKGIIGWLDLTADNLDAQAEALLAQPKFAGVRAHAPNHFEADWFLRPEALRGLRSLSAKGMPIDFLINCTNLDKFEAVLDAVPDVRAVLNHGGRPFVMTGDTRAWEQSIRSVARRPNCYCKLSGLAERAGVEWDAETLKPWVAILLDAFGPERLIFASNWPVMTLMATPQNWIKTLISIFDDLGVAQDWRENVFSRTALNIYCTGQNDRAGSHGPQ